MGREIKTGSVRWTDDKGSKYVIQPSDSRYEGLRGVAQETFDSVTRQWRNAEVFTPDVVRQKDSYRVRLDGVLVPWFEVANRTRGFVDLWALSSAGEQVEGITYAVIKHRLFGVVKFEKIVTL